MSIDIAGQFLAGFQKASNHLQNAGLVLFYYLAGFQLVLSALWMSFKNSWPDFFAKMIQLFFTFGLFYGLVKFGGTFIPDIVNIFIQIGKNTSGIQNLNPSSILLQGIDLAENVMSSGWNAGAWGSGLILGILGAVFSIFAVFMYALIAADLAVLLVKSYALISFSGLIFAFGAHEQVRPIAVNYFKAIIGIGLQLLVFYILLGVGSNLGQLFANDIKVLSITNLSPYFAMLGGIVIFYLIIKNVPPFIAGLSGIGGFQSFGDAAVGIAISGAMQAASLGKTGGKTLGVSSRAGGGIAAAVGSVAASAVHGAKASSGNVFQKAASGMATAAKHTAKAAEGMAAHKSTKAWNKMAGKACSGAGGFNDRMRGMRGEDTVSDKMKNESNVNCNDFSKGKEK